MNTSPTRVLIVDDDRALLTALTGALKLRMPEIEVDTCESGVAAIEAIRRNDYDAVVSDIKMPGMDGLALLKEIRSIQPELPTLLITGHGQHDLAVQALRGGAFDFIQKPVERDYLVASLARAIRVRTMGRQLQQQQEELASHADRLEQAVESRTEQLRELNRRKDGFLATLSHELRNPLACILSAAELMLLPERESESDAINPEMESCGIIVQQASHMRRLLDDLLDLSRINCNKISLRKKHVPLRRVIDAAVASTKPFMLDRRHTLQVNMAPTVAAGYVHADPTRLEQVVVNLLNNAAKYSDPGGQIQMTVERDGTEIIIAVEDDGIGIPQHVLSSVFEPFVQVEADGRRTDGGLGIGLALVRQLVELHGGGVTASSEGENKGSCFTVRLPIAVEATRSSTADEAEHGADRPPSRRVLVVEDQDGLALLTQRLLEQDGQQVIAVASDGPSAIKAALAHSPDLILMDIGLPGMNGYEVARRLRELPQFDDTILVAMTGYGTNEDRDRAHASGFDFHLVKPCTFKTLSECIRTSWQPRRSAPILPR